MGQKKFYCKPNLLKYVFTLFFLYLTAIAAAQNSTLTTLPKAVLPHGNPKAAAKDTVMESDTTKENKEPRYYYFSVNADIFVNTKGGFTKRLSPALEFGKTFGICDLGLATGRTNSFSSGSDTVRYIEFRPTLNIFSQGRFAEGLCLGAGYIFKARQGLITEICNSINFNITTKIAVAVTQGYYFFDGTNSSRSTQYVGFTFTYNFLRSHSVNNQRKRALITKDN